MAIQAVGVHHQATPGRTSVPSLPKARLATAGLGSGPHVERFQANSRDQSATVALMGDFLGARVSGTRSSGGVASRVYETARRAPSNVTYKNGNAHVFGHRTWTPGTAKNGMPGYNSCALVASAILKEAGVDVPMRSQVVRLESDLQGRGWKKVDVSKIKKGDVVIWKHKSGANHVGFYTGWGLNRQRGFGQTTVDNWSLTGEPEFRALHRETEWNWRIRKVLRPPS